ncbi:major capsid protein [Thaumasiovibrio sp. DFM-14]
MSGDGASAISDVGGALIGLAGLAVVFKWVKGAIFG